MDQSDVDDYERERIVSSLERIASALEQIAVIVPDIHEAIRTWSHPAVILSQPEKM